MTTELLNSSEAAEIFLKMLIAQAYDGAIEGMKSYLEKGPPGRKPSQELVTLYQWFRNLDGESQKYVLTISRKAVDFAIFECLVLLDGLTGGNPIEGKTSDFAVCLQTYKDENARTTNSSQTSVRLNPAHTTDYDLHDKFRLILEERAENGK